MDIISMIADEIGAGRGQVEAAVKLIDEGNTIPFIARYRKEATGSLDDEKLRLLFAKLTYLRNLEARKQEVIALIDEQGKLTDELKKAILAAEKLVTVEDLYRPYKQKKKTRAEMARKRGLAPLAEFIMLQNTDRPVEEEAAKYVTGKIEPESSSKEDAVKAAEKEVIDVAAAIAGASDIIAEDISDNAQFRDYIRRVTEDEGKLRSEAKDAEAESVYQNYYAFEEEVRKIAGHRVLAINRGEAEKILTVSVVAPEDKILGYLEKQLITNENIYTTPVIKAAVADSYKRLISPSIEREIRNSLTDMAQSGAIDVFGKNLRQLLMQPPIAGQTVLGWDPAFRTGCKLAIVDPTGKVLDTKVIYPTAPHNKIEESKKILRALISKYKVTLISIGNGTASRESEQVVSELLREIPEKVSYIITNEAGASVYSASPLGTEEFPNFDVGQRSAASIARRVQDPLSELVKIEPKAIGVGQYQHDMDQKKLAETLTGVVEDAVNSVGVDLNTASFSLLSYISGINGTIAKNIVAYREKNGKFHSRAELLKVAKLGPKAFEQCAGFCRINGGDEPLDATAVHPESYKQARALLEKMNCGINDEEAIKTFRKSVGSLASLAAELGCGEITLSDILSEIEKPARDPREEMPRPVLRSDVLEMKDLKPGMKLKGTVRNVIDFGAFVDIGVHEDGLVHISRMSDRFIKHPLEVVSVGDIVEVTVLEVDEKKGRISLTMIDETKPKQAPGATGGRNDRVNASGGDRRGNGAGNNRGNGSGNDRGNGNRDRRNDRPAPRGTMADLLSKLKL
ncbi:MAG: RNA-binding transcriptional accessory protein [Lachnospiraceae bacterium]|nr:RNA-binding transcriptional accessory protein [Lachnospiraceae bacterium]